MKFYLVNINISIYLLVINYNYKIQVLIKAYICSNKTQNID